MKDNSGLKKRELASVLHDGEPAPEPSPHDVCVDAWLKSCATGLTREDLLRLLEAALGALWARTTPTLGEVTLTAIADRVLFTATENFPLFAGLKVEPSSGIALHTLRTQVSGVDDSYLVAGIRFVLVEFLTVLGNLTADILSPELHAELAQITLPDTENENPP